MLSYDQKERMETLLLLINKSSEEQEELIGLLQKYNQRRHSGMDSIVHDDNDPDPESIAARQHMIWCEHYDRDRKRNERNAAFAERYYKKRGEEMNKHRI